MSGAALGDTLAAILSELIALPSPYPPGDSRAICAYAARHLQTAGYAVETLARRENVDSVVARLGGGRPSLAFNAHVDTVAVGEAGAWRSDPFQATLADGRLYGLGASNCKASMAVQLWLAEEIARCGGPARGELVFAFVGDEERLGPDGSSYLREIGKLVPDILVLGAPTENHLITAERGVLWATVTSTGRAAHAGEPAAGDNAILRAMRLLAALQAVLAPRLAARRAGAMLSTMNIGMIRGGHNANVVPSACSFEIDRRLLPDETVAQAFAELEAVLEGAGEPAGSYGVELLTGTNGFAAPRDGPGIAALAAAIEAERGEAARFIDAVGVSDGRYYADDGIEIVNFGPGGGLEGHAANESVALSEMVEAALVLRCMVAAFLGLGG